jgi:hypothetical protein
MAGRLLFHLLQPTVKTFPFSVDAISMKNYAKFPVQLQITVATAFLDQDEDNMPYKTGSVKCWILLPFDSLNVQS